MKSISTHPNAKPCPHGYGALSHCQQCRRLRANEALTRSAQRRQAQTEMAALIATVIGPIPSEELEALLRGIGPPLRTTQPNAKTCVHGKTPMCEACRKKHRSQATQRWQKRKRRGESEGGVFCESEGGIP